MKKENWFLKEENWLTRLLDREVVSFRRLRQSPVFYTSLMGAMGLLSWASVGFALAAAPVMIPPLIVGASGDLASQAVYHYRHKRWKRHDSLLAKVIDIDYFERVIDTVRREYGLKGRCLKIEAIGAQGGTGIFQGGYFTELDLKFRNGEAKILYKYDDRPNMMVGSVVSALLREHGHDFVPKSFFVGTRYTKLGSMGKNYSRRGCFYEYLKGDTLENRLKMGEDPVVDPASVMPEVVASHLSDLLFDIYSDDSMHGRLDSLGPRVRDDELPDLSELEMNLLAVHNHTFHNKLSRRLLELENLEGYTPEMPMFDVQKLAASTRGGVLVNELNSAYMAAQKGVHLKLIHGDLHQGNIFCDDDEKKVRIIDWDSAQFGIPYQDFYYFALLSDFDKSPDYPELRRKFLERQDALMPGIKEEYIKLVEFETELSRLILYYSVLEKGEVRPEFRENMKSSCRYLLEKAHTSMSDYLELSGNTALADSYFDWEREAFPLLDGVPFNPRASVAYAYTVNHRYRTRQGDEALQNYDEHMKRVESLVIHDALDRNLLVGDVGMNIGLLGLVFAGNAYLGRLDRIPTSYYVMAGLLVASCVGYYHKESVFRGIANVVRKLTGSERGQKAIGEMGRKFGEAEHEFIRRYEERKKKEKKD